MMSTHAVTWEQKQVALDFLTQAVRALEAPSASLFGTSSDGEIPAITEANRQVAIQHLLRAVTCLIPSNHPDVPLRADIERWIGR